MIKTVTGEEVTQEELGGAHAHNVKSGVAHYQAADEQDCLEFARELLSYLPSNNLDEPPARPGGGRIPRPRWRSPTTTASWTRSSPTRRVSPTTCTRSSSTCWTTASSWRSTPGSRRTSSSASAGSRASPVGVVANQPMHSAGTLDIDASEKAARFVRTCDAFGVPVLTFVDVPGFLPGTGQEWGGIIRRGAKLIYAYAEATVPKITVITRKAYGGAYDVMGSKHLGGDINLAWPTAQIAVMGADGAVDILYRRDLAAIEDEQRAGRAAGGEDRRVRGHALQPLHRGRARLRGRGHPSRGDAIAGHPGAAGAADQAPDAAAEEARQYPAVTARRRKYCSSAQRSGIMAGC